MTEHDAAGQPPPQRDGDARKRAVQASLERYWMSNVRIMAILTVLWLLVGLGCGVLFADVLNEYYLPGTGYPLGFWFAQQGSIIGFVLIILVYCILMNRLDVRHHAELEDLRNGGREGS
jgi:putative solute:sodium symporter small subunit